MVDRGTRRRAPFREDRDRTVFSYLVAGGAQTVYEYVSPDAMMRKFYIKLNFKNFTAGRLMTVDVDIMDVDGTYVQVDTVQYTCNTAGENDPYIEVEHFDDVRIQCTIDIVEAGNVDIERDIDVWPQE